MLAGAAVGALIGQALIRGDRRKQATIALAALGGIIGGTIGYRRGLDSSVRQCALYMAAQQRNTEMVSATINSGSNQPVGEIAITPDDGHFVQGSDQLTAKGRDYYTALARQYTGSVQLARYEAAIQRSAKQDPQLAELSKYRADNTQRQRLQREWSELRIILTGHSDDQGDGEAAITLTENRAKNVGDLFQQVGVPAGNLFYQGAGAAYPIADNNNPEEQSKNNRVEVVVLYGDKAAYEYADTRIGDPGLFSPKEPDAVQDMPVVAAVTPPTTKPGVNLKPGQKPAPKVVQKPAQKPIAPVVRAPAIKVPPSPDKPTPAPVVVVNDGSLDFGGAPFTVAPNLFASIGKPVRNEGFSITRLFGIGTAVADAQGVPSCTQDDPARYKPGEIKRLATGAPMAVKGRPPSESRYLNIVRRSYIGLAGDHLLNVSNLTIRASGEPAEPTRLNIFKDYKSKSQEEQGKVAADITDAPASIGFRGDKGVLIRQFFISAQGVKCMDMVIPNNRDHQELNEVVLFYKYGGQNQLARLRLSLNWP